MEKLLFALIVIVTCSSFEQIKIKQPAPVQKKKLKKKAAAVKAKPTTAVVDTTKIVPNAIQKKIDAYKKMDQSEQPRSVTEYEYKGKKVYYVSMHCCDFFNELYDADGKLMGHPDGGMTGRGDKTLPDFNTEKTKEKLIWSAGK